MAFNLYSTDLPELAVNRESPQLPFIGEEACRGHCLCMSHSFGKGFYREIYFDGIHIGYGNLSLAQKALIHFDTDFESVEMHFALNGSTTAFSDTFKQNPAFTPNQHNIIYANNFRGKVEWSGNDCQIFEVNMSPALFNKYLPGDSLIFEIFQKKVNDGCSSLMVEQNHVVTLQMFQIIQDIIHCERKDLFKRMFLEAKVMELLLLQLEQFCDSNTASAPIKKSDIEKIYAVRDFILGNLTRPCSLTELTRKVGTNEFTLKKGFKALFGTTVFGFWNDAKMQEARKMLQTQVMNVSEVADAIGYKNQQHFTAAFKRKFGVAPSHIKGMR